MTHFESKVKQHIERLSQHTSREIETEVARKRIAWLQQNYQMVGNAGRPSPRQAFELLFFDYLELPKNQLHVVSETESEIVWLSLNPCPTLEATRALGLDTRQICRAAYEKSTQAFLSQLDPQLRFLRSYAEIRPYANHCKEMIVRVDFEEMMRIALEEAKAAQQEGIPGYGAVVVLGRQILGQAHDRTIANRDPSLHAERNAIRQAVQVFGDTNLSGAILFSTCEPCPLCSALAVEANLTTIIYGVSIDETARLSRSKIASSGGSSRSTPSETSEHAANFAGMGARTATKLDPLRLGTSAKEIIEKSPVMIEVIGDVLNEECMALYI